MTPLEHLARRMSRDPAFLGWWIDSYLLRHAIPESRLLTLLGCDVDTLTRLRMCRTPSPREVVQVAEWAGVSRPVLADVAAGR